MNDLSQSSLSRTFFTPAVRYLIIANVAIYVPGALFPGFDSWFTFDPELEWIQPWTAFTHMFIHGNLEHLFLNMFMLFHFGPELEKRWGQREFIQLYLFAGLGGLALHYWFYPDLGLLGASGAIYGVSLVSALKSPDAAVHLFGIFPPIKAKYLVGVSAVGTVGYVLSPQADGISHAAHLGGMAASLLYLKYFRTKAGPKGLRQAPTP